METLTLPPTEAPPRLSALGMDLLKITKAQRIFTLAVPFIFAAIYFYAAFSGHWVIALAAVMYLSFVTYGSTSHDLVHRNLGLSHGANDFFLTMTELLGVRSGHAYRMSHLHHHARFPEEDDIEASAARKTLFGALVEGVVFHLRLWIWALGRSKGSERRVILFEGCAALGMVLLSIALCTRTVVPLVYVLLMISGAWITPLVTSFVVHNANGKTELEQTRVFRGKMFSLIGLEHLYHLEHHLYPLVPHQNWPLLAKRLDPYFERQGVKPINFWF